MPYTIQFVYILAVLWYHVGFVDLTSAQTSSYLKVEFIQRDVNASIISSTFSTLSPTQCAYRCTRQSSPSLYFVEEEQTCHCNNALDTNTEENPDNPEIVYGYPYTDTLDEATLYKDCLELYDAGFTEDGVYTIHPVDPIPVDVWCDITGGGWTVFQRRQDGSEDFYRGWSDYVSGFGNKTGEYWLGLDNLHALTSQPTELHIFMDTFGDVSPISANTSYSTFRVDDPSMKYRLHWDGFTGDCGVHTATTTTANGMDFSTFDNDNDQMSAGNCVEFFKGAWWQNGCSTYNLNGIYRHSNENNEVGGIAYGQCWDAYYSLKTVIMKLRRVPA